MNATSGCQYDFSPKNVAKFKHLGQKFNRRIRVVPMASRYGTLGWCLRGWGNYFSLIETNSYYFNQDQWVRRRSRASA
jgi:hypothetical protein